MDLDASTPRNFCPSPIRKSARDASPAAHFRPARVDAVAFEMQRTAGEPRNICTSGLIRPRPQSLGCSSLRWTWPRLDCAQLRACKTPAGVDFRQFVALSWKPTSSGLDSTASPAGGIARALVRCLVSAIAHPHISGEWLSREEFLRQRKSRLVDKRRTNSLALFLTHFEHSRPSNSWELNSSRPPGRETPALPPARWCLPCLGQWQNSNVHRLPRE